MNNVQIGLALLMTISVFGLVTLLVDWQRARRRFKEKQRGAAVRTAPPLGRVKRS